MLRDSANDKLNCPGDWLCGCNQIQRSYTSVCPRCHCSDPSSGPARARYVQRAAPTVKSDSELIVRPVGKRRLKYDVADHRARIRRASWASIKPSVSVSERRTDTEPTERSTLPPIQTTPSTGHAPADGPVAGTDNLLLAPSPIARSAKLPADDTQSMLPSAPQESVLANGRSELHVFEPDHGRPRVRAGSRKRPPTTRRVATKFCPVLAVGPCSHCTGVHTTSIVRSTITRLRSNGCDRAGRELLLKSASITSRLPTSGSEWNEPLCQWMSKLERSLIPRGPTQAQRQSRTRNSGRGSRAIVSSPGLPAACEAWQPLAKPHRKSSHRDSRTSASSDGFVSGPENPIPADIRNVKSTAALPSRGKGASHAAKTTASRSNRSSRRGTTAQTQKNLPRTDIAPLSEQFPVGGDLKPSSEDSCTPPDSGDDSDTSFDSAYDNKAPETAWNQLAVSVNRDDRRTIKIIEEMGLPVRRENERKEHELAAALRAGHMIKCLQLAARTSTHINIPFDMTRMRRLVRRYNAMVDPRHALILHDAEDDDITTRDMCYPASDSETDYHHAADAVFIDINDVGPDQVARILSLGSGVGYYSANIYEGNVGGVTGGIAWKPSPKGWDYVQIATSLAASRKTIHRERWLYRETTHRVTFREGGTIVTRYLNVMLLTEHQGRAIYKVVLTPTRPGIFETSLTPANRTYATMRIPGKAIASSFSSFFSRQWRIRIPFTSTEVYVHRAAYTELHRVVLTSASPSSASLTLTKFDNVVKGDWEYELLQNCFPEVAGRIRRDTIKAAQYVEKAEIIDSMVELAHSHKPLTDSLSALYQGRLPDEFDLGDALKKTALISTVISGLLLLYRERHTIGKAATTLYAALIRLPHVGPFIKKNGPMIVKGGSAALANMKAFLLASPTLWTAAILLALILAYRLARRYDLATRLQNAYDDWRDNAGGSRFASAYNEHKYSSLDNTRDGTGDVTGGPIKGALNTGPQCEASNKLTDPDKKLRATISGIDCDQTAELGQTTPAESKARVWPLVVTRGLSLFAAPIGGLRGLYTALKERTMLQQNVADAPAWDEMTRDFILSLPDTGEPLDPVPVDEWISSITDPQKRRLMESFIRETEEAKIDPSNLDYLSAMNKMRKLGMHSKKDEILPLKTSGDGVLPGTKDRLITSTSMEVQLLLQPWIRAASKRLKTCLEKPLFIRGHYFHITYASGMVASDLDVWLAETLVRSEQGVISFIVMGDDSLIRYVHPDHPSTWREIDYSQYDQSQGTVHITAEMMVLAFLGVPPEVVAYQYAVLGLPSQSKQRNKKRLPFKITFTPAKGTHRRVSGAPDTSFGNSVDNIISLLIVILGGFTDDAWALTGLKRGLDRSHIDLEDATFLRGSFHLTVDKTYRWIPLASQLVKLGKINKYMKEPMESVQARQYIYGMARSFAIVPRELPVLGRFLAMYDRIGSDHDTVVEREIAHDHFYKPLGDPDSDAPDIDRSAYRAWLIRRYGVDDTSIDEFDAACDDNTEVQILLPDDRVTQRLVKVDYLGLELP